MGGREEVAGVVRGVENVALAQPDVPMAVLLGQTLLVYESLCRYAIASVQESATIEDIVSVSRV